ncbi:MAG: LamG-like jellyroll fold domain-containing protein [Sedimentisphaerales bacterium]
MLEKKFVRALLCLLVALIFSATVAMGADILFISSMNYNAPVGDDQNMSGDDALKAFMEGLGHTVTYFDDDENEADTEAAAAAADLVFISETVGSGGIRNEITEIETPMVITEAWAWDEMGLTEGSGTGIDVATTDIEIFDPGHYLSAGLSGTVPVLTDITDPVSGTARFSMGIAGGEGTVIARATLSDGQSYDVLIVYEKGAALAQAPADGSDQVAADIRVCLGFDRRSYPLWNENAYALFEAAINYALGTTGPLTQARSPRPRDGAIDVPQDAVLSWGPGTYADKHDVYFGTVSDDVDESSRTNPQDVLVSQNQIDTTYDPPGLLEFGQTYYWRVDELNDLDPNSPWKGNVWSFTVIDHFIVDNFEDYNDFSPHEIFSTWIDGYEVETNGALIGHDADFTKGEHIAETTIVHWGKQSMPFYYDNSGPANYSETERAFSPAQDWTREGVGVLSLWFRGHPPYVGGFTEGPAGTYTMTASGADIWGNADQFHFAFKQVSGAASIAAKVESVQNTNEFAKTGVMIRDTLEAGSANASLLITPENGVRFQFRNTTGGSTDRFFVEGITAPQWVKLERTVGGLVRAYYSADGNTWTQLNLTTVTMGTPMYIGLALTSHDSALTCEAKFSNVTSDGTGQWDNEDIGMLSNEAEPMYVTVKDGSGTAATVYHDDPNVSLIDTWTEWNIDLKEFSNAGVVLTDVSNLAIGLGDKNNPQPGGSGLVFFDDIRLYLSRAADIPITDGLVAYYPLDEGSGNTTADISGSGHDGIIQGTPTWIDSKSGYGKALYFEGQDPASGWVNCGTWDPSAETGQLTVALWVRWDGAVPGVWQGIIGKRDDWAEGQVVWYMEVNMDNQQVAMGRYGVYPNCGGRVLPKGEWAHVAATFDGTTLAFYINGEEAGRDNFSLGEKTDATIEIGCDNLSGWNSFHGTIDKVYIFNRALSGLEVLYLASQ